MKNIEQNVMASVGLIYTVRTLVSARALKFYALLISLGGAAAFVSLPHIIENTSLVIAAGLPNIFFYILAAVLGTTLIVQVALFIAACAGVSLLVDLVRPARVLSA